MSKQSILNCTYQNNEALMIVDYNDVDLVKAIEQESHLNKTYSERDKNKACCFVCQFKIKRKKYYKDFMINRNLLFAITTIEYIKGNKSQKDFKN